MKAGDFILLVREDLQEKSQHWTPESLLAKLKASYVALQFDLPYFVSRIEIDIKEGKQEYYLDYVALKNISLKVDGVALKYASPEYFYATSNKSLYTFEQNKLIINMVPIKDSVASLVCKFEKNIVNENCEIEIPHNWLKALRLHFLSEIHEKPTRNTKERVLSVHYIKLYEREIYKLKSEQKTRPTGITSKFQRI